MIDSHTHSKFSHDGRQTMPELFGKAQELGLEYLAVTEHLDLEGDYVIDRPLDLDAYYNEFQLQKNRFRIPKLAFGCEFGYSKEGAERYLKCPYLSKFDVIINSVHYVNGEDPYFPSYFTEKPNKNAAYNLYFQTVLESLDAPYPYQIVGHIGYILRYAPYENKNPEGDTLDLIDHIFRRAIELGKTVEVNTHTKQSGFFSVPDFERLKRYRELGGENVTFSSDAHYPLRLGDKYAETAEAVKRLGFRYWTVYRNQEPLKIKI